MKEDIIALYNIIALLAGIMVIKIFYDMRKDQPGEGDAKRDDRENKREDR